MTSLPKEDRQLLGRFVTNLDSNIYCIQSLPPEVTAVLFAYVSRSPASFRENLLKLLKSKDLEVADLPPVGGGFDKAEEKARKFHEKWVVGYGHASVAEHADIKYAIEDVSILASKVIEDNRLAAYTEKSSRYQVFSVDRFYVPEALQGDEEYHGFLRKLNQAYLDMTEVAQAKLKERYPQEEGVSKRVYENTLRAKALDVTRYLLPAASFTAIGMSANARVAAHAINKLLSHPLPEMHAIGEQMLAEGKKVCPALLKYVGPQEHLRRSLGGFARELREQLAIGQSLPADTTPLRLECLTPEPEATLVASLAYEATGTPFAAALKKAITLSPAERREVIDQAVAGMGDFDWPSRAFERVVFRTEMVVDYGAYRDIQRHRMATQHAQPLGVGLGYDTPADLEWMGLADEYTGLMDEAATVYAGIAEQHPEAAAYVVPFAYRIRVLFDWNLREVAHFVKLRSGREGHISYRIAAQRVWQAMESQYPAFADLLRVDRNEYDLERLESEQRIEAKQNQANSPGADSR